MKLHVEIVMILLQMGSRYILAIKEMKTVVGKKFITSFQVIGDKQFAHKVSLSRACMLGTKLIKVRVTIPLSMD